MASYTSRSVEETITFARKCAETLQPNDIIALCGDLGAGKTHFVKGLAAGCGSDEVATSPTFTLLHEYRGGRMPIFHFDFYRIVQRAEIEQLGFDEMLNEGGVAVIEWADRFPELLPPRARWIRISANSKDERVIAENE